MRKTFTAAVMLLIVGAAVAVAAQQRTLTLDDIYHPSRRLNFAGAVPSNLEWIDATHFAWPKNIGDGVAWTSVDVDGAERALFDVVRMQDALTRAGVTAADAATATRSPSLVFTDTYTAALADIAGDLFVYAFGSDRATRVTNTPQAHEEHLSFSPDGRFVAFVRAGNLYAAPVDGSGERMLTSDGAPEILNGKLDWVYEEEIYGRGLNRAYWWSPDSSQLAFLHIDDRPVPEFTVVDQIPYDQTIEQWEYPKAGDPNPDVALQLVPVGGGAPKTVPMDGYPAADRLIVAVSWTPDSRRVVYLVQNRVQSFVDVNTADAQSLAPSRLLHEQSEYWIDPDDAKPPVWLKDGSFLWMSTRTGFKHIYRYDADGSHPRPITSGDWEVRTLHGVDEPRGLIYFSGTERSPIGGDVYRVNLDGSALQRLSAAAGTHEARFNPAFSYYIDNWSDVTTPPQVRLHRADGEEARVIAANPPTTLAEFALSRPEFMQVMTRDGFVMEAMMIKPRDFDPSRKYPIYQFTYGGPHAQRVLNAWRSENLYHQLLAQQGIIVWVCDNRTASGKGARSEWPLYRNLGEVELRDIEDGVSWLKHLPYVDGGRIGLHGWSYGGFMTSYAMTHSTSFAMGIAGGTVADWRNYDTVYTERYLGVPKDNPDGYRKSSPRWNAGNLHGDLLLIHGAIDDNVHVANTIQLVYELQKAGKPFELMLYPKSRHGVTDRVLEHHLRELMFDYTLRHLQPDDHSGTSNP